MIFRMIFDPPVAYVRCWICMAYFKKKGKYKRYCSIHIFWEPNMNVTRQHVHVCLRR